MGVMKTAAAIYLLTLAILLVPVFVAPEKPILSDAVTEYHDYAYTIETGEWYTRGDSLVSSCLFSNYIPAMVQRWTGWDALMVFRIFPKLIYAMAPAFIYLATCLYTRRHYALLAPALFLSNFFILYQSEIGRVGVGLGIAAGLVYAILARKWYLSLLFACLLPFAHYGAMFSMWIIIGGALLILIAKRHWLNVRSVAVPLVILLAVGSIWHFGIVASSGHITIVTMKNTVNIESTASQSVVSLPAPTTSPLPDPTESDTDGHGFWSLETRDPTIQAAFGKTWPYMNAAQRVEFFAAWSVVLLLASGVVYTLWKVRPGMLYLSIAIPAVLFFLVVLIMPAAGKYYGIYRTYTTSLLVLAPCFAIISNRLKWYVLAAALVLYSLCLAGVVHGVLGVVK